MPILAVLAFGPALRERFTMLLLAVLTFGGDADLLRVPTGTPVAVRTEVGRATAVDLPAGDAVREYGVVVGSLARKLDAVPIRVRLTETALPEAATTCDDEPTAAWTQRVRDVQRTMAARRADDAEPVRHEPSECPETRRFHLFVQEDDFLDAAGYAEVTARRMAVGRSCVVYLDEQDDPASYPPETVAEIVRTFDEVVIPGAERLFGRHRDVDRDGRFAILLTHWLGELQGGKVSLGGFVRGSDFYRDVQQPFSNCCDMMYLNSDLQPGPHLRTLIAHEYTHAVTFSRHVFGHYLPGGGGRDEVAFLNEAISHLAENLLGDGWSNLDYRIATCLGQTGRYSLVVPDYYSAGLWRCHGSRGSTYLFLRWLVDVHGVDVLKRLVQSNLDGVENLEAATGRPFAALFRDWCVALHAASADAGDTVWTGDLGRRLVCGSRPMDVPQGRSAFELVGTSSQLLRVRVPAGRALRLTIEPTAPLETQVTVVPRPTGPVVDLRFVAGASARSGRLVVDHRSGPAVAWQRIGWECATLPLDTTPEWMKGGGGLDAAEVFATTASRAGDELVGDPIDLGRFAERAVTVKLVGATAEGRVVAAWADVPADRTVPLIAAGDASLAR